MTHKPRAPVTDEHRHIWLSPQCDADCERTWCQDNQGPCDECGAKWTKYVLADASLLRPESSFEVDWIEGGPAPHMEGLADISGGVVTTGRNQPEAKLEGKT